MKWYIHMLLIMIAVVLFGSCKSVTNSGEASSSQTTTATTIMPLGASRVEGSRPEYESFRYPFWERLVESGREVDFVGTRYDNAPYLDVNNVSFDRDHQGLSGWTSGQILEELPRWLEEVGAPDIVLFSSPGGNDALEGLPFDDAFANVNAIIDKLQEANPNVSIVIDTMAPTHSDMMENDSDLSEFLRRMQNAVPAIASDQTTEFSRVRVVDLATGFRDEYLVDDQVHYNQAGANFVADRYYSVLEDVFESE
ncbi:MAG: hypothetical protein K9L24_03750 [Spirochaetia bacterium]|nr:hypothetical protein [Spirochaetia bacterium]MCF7953831.1 hypothetical protein [Spirochaetales bacterium]